MIDDFVQTAIEIDEGIGAPQTTRQFFAGDQLSRVFEQRQQQLNGLVAEWRSMPVAGQFARTGVKSEPLEPVGTRGLNAIRHRPHSCRARASVSLDSNADFTEKRKLILTNNPFTLGDAAMNTTLLLRVASAISLLFTVGHTLGGLQKWSPMGENDVLKAMTAVRFDTFGASRSYLDLFLGFGWSISVAMLLQTVLLWQLAALAQPDPTRVRPMIAVFVLATLASGIIAWRFIFPVPALFSGVLLIALVAAYWSAR
jgi:hypothetical protein